MTAVDDRLGAAIPPEAGVLRGGRAAGLALGLLSAVSFGTSDRKSVV